MGSKGFKNDVEVLILQQHCGGNTITLFKDFVAPKGNE